MDRNLPVFPLLYCRIVMHLLLGVCVLAMDLP